MTFKIQQLSHDLQTGQITVSIIGNAETAPPTAVTLVTSSNIPPSDKEPGVRKRAIEAAIQALEGALALLQAEHH